MLERLRNGPWWVLAIFAGALFLIGQIPVVVLVAEGRSPLVGVLVALICSVFFGAFFGIVMARLRRRFAPLLEGPDGGQLTPAQRKALGRAALRGPLPVDLAQRQAAARLARVNLDLLRGQRWYAVPVFLVMTVLSAFLAATDSPWYALATALFAAAFAYWLWAYRQVRRRRPLLEAPPGS